MISRRSFLATASAAAASPLLAAADKPARIRFGQIGTQHAHAAGKMETLRRMADVYEVVGLSEDGGNKVDTYADLPRMTTEELLALPDLKAVTVETRVEDSSDRALKAIRAGKHIHLDKPGALKLEDFKAMRLEAEKSGLTVQMGYMLRYNPAFELLFQAARDGWLGEITEIDGMMGKLADKSTRGAIRKLEGGGMFELGCHMIDAVVTLLGKPAEVKAISTPTQSDGVQDNQLAVFTYPKVTVTLRCNHADPFGGQRRRFQATGTKGSIEIMPMESGQATVRFSEPRGSYKKGEQHVKLTMPKGRYDGEFIDLAKILRGEKKLAWDAEHDIAVYETVLRAAGLPV